MTYFQQGTERITLNKLSMEQPVTTNNVNAFSIGATLSVPFKILRFGHVFLVLYSGGLSAALIYGAQQLYIFTRVGVLQFSFLLQSTHKFMVEIQWIIGAFIGILCIPFIVAFITTPLPIIARLGSLPINELGKLTFPSIQRAIATFYLVARKAWGILLAPLALYIFYHSYVLKTPGENAWELFLGISVLVTLGVLFEVIPLLSAPILGICGQLSPYDALNNYQLVYRPIKIRLLMITVAILMILGGAEWYAFKTLDELPRLFSMIGIGVAVIWYLLSVIAGETIRRIDELNPAVFGSN